MGDVRQHHLTWSKTINDVRFRLFALTGGCGKDDCPACSLADGQAPMWALFFLPKRTMNEWCLMLIAFGEDAGEVEDAMRDMVERFGLATPERQTWWRKAAALYGVSWSTLIGNPWAVCANQHIALDDLIDPRSPLAKLVDTAGEEELRALRKHHSDGQFYSLGGVFGAVWLRVMSREEQQGHEPDDGE